MCKPWRHPELAVIFLCQRNTYPLPEGRGATANIDSNVKHGPPRHTNQLPLRKWRQLIVQATQDTDPTAAVVILHELWLPDGLGPRLGVVALHEKPSGIPEDLRFNDEHAGNFCFDKFHTNSQKKIAMKNQSSWQDKSFFHHSTLIEF